MRKGMMVEIYKPADGSDCTNDGVTSKAKEALLVGDDIPQIFSEREGVPVLRVERRAILDHCPGCGDNALGEKWDYISAVPVDLPEGIHPAAGGNFIYSCDSRFRVIFEYPIPVHDHIVRSN